jgi:hypothetical protein
MGISNADWHRKSLQITNQNLRGTNASSGRSSVGPRGIDKAIQVGGKTGGGIGVNAVNTDQLGNIQTSTHLNLQHSILPLVSDATIVITTTNATHTADIQIYGAGGVGTNISIYRPDGSIMLSPPVLATTQSHDFGSTGVSVYIQVYYDVFHDALGNGKFIAVWSSSAFTAPQLNVAFQDAKVPFLASPGNTNTHLATGTAGTYTNTTFGAYGTSGGAGTLGLTTIAGETGPAITLASADSSITITPVVNNIDFAVNHIDASKVTTGLLALARGGTHTDLSATGGAHKFLSQATVGSDITVVQPAFTDISGVASAAQLPNPTATTLGGIESLAAVTSKWINTISTAGVPSATQPAFTDISGTLASTQMPALTGDVTSTIDTVVTTLAAIQGVPIIYNPPLSPGDVLQYNGIDWVPSAGGIINGQILFLDKTADGVIATYNKIQTTPDTSAEASNSATCSTSKTLIQSYVTAIGFPGTSLIPAGSWAQNMYTQISNASGTTTLTLDVYSRTQPGGVETLLFSTNQVISGLGTTVNFIEWLSVQPAFTVNFTDRIVIKVSGTVTGSNKTVSVFTNGTTHYSNVQTPITTTNAVSAHVVNTIATATYTALQSDVAKMLLFTDNAAITMTLPQAGSSGNFANGWYTIVHNAGNNTLTIMPTTSLIDGDGSVLLTANQSVWLVSDGTNYWTASAKPLFADIGGTCAVNQGGTGLTSYTTGDILYASGATILAKLSDVAVGSVLVSGGVGVAPTYSTTPAVSGANITASTIPTTAMVNILAQIAAACSMRF